MTRTSTSISLRLLMPFRNVSAQLILLQRLTVPRSSHVTPLLLRPSPLRLGGWATVRRSKTAGAAAQRRTSGDPGIIISGIFCSQDFPLD